MSKIEKRILAVGAVLVAIGVYYGVSMVYITNQNAPLTQFEQETVEELEKELVFLEELLDSVNNMTEKEKEEISSDRLRDGLEMEIAKLQTRLRQMRAGVAPQKTTPKRKGGMVI